MKLLKVSALVVGMLVASVLMLTLLSIRGLPAARGGFPVPAQNGDANCDGKVNLADAVYLLQYIFKGGEAPCAIAQDACCPELVDQIKALRDAAAPKPENRVSLSVRTGSRAFYTVPVGKALIVTDVNSTPGFKFEITDDRSSRIPALGSSFHSNSGVVFGSGSELFARLSEPGGGEILLTGYLLDA